MVSRHNYHSQSCYIYAIACYFFPDTSFPSCFFSCYLFSSSLLLFFLLLFFLCRFVLLLFFLFLFFPIFCYFFSCNFFSCFFFSVSFFPVTFFPTIIWKITIDAMWQRWPRSTLAQIMACYLTLPSHYPNRRWRCYVAFSREQFRPTCSCSSLLKCLRWLHF